jgi:hypothetical protein
MEDRAMTKAPAASQHLGRTSRLVATLFATTITLAIAVASAPAAGIQRSSTFNSNDENWIVLTDSGFFSPAYHSTDGNPGGYVSAFDSGYGFDNSRFQAPFNVWGGKASGNYGGTLSVDFRNSAASDHGPQMTIYTSNFRDPVCAVSSQVPTSSWQTFQFTLNASVFSVCGIRPITGPQMTAALAGFEGITVGTSTSFLSETMDVDNASLSGGDAGPTGKVSRTLTAKFVSKAHRFKGALDAEDDFSCAHDQKVQVFRRAKGPDQKVGTATTAPQSTHEATSDAKFALKNHAKAGTYYAMAPSASATLDGNTCRPAKSPAVKVK